MTWLLDGNLLVALRLSRHEHHERAHRWFARSSPDRFATCAVTQGTLLRLHMQLAVDPSAAAAWTALREISDHSRHVFWEGGFSYLDVPYKLLTGHRQVTDAWLAELARRQKGKVATLDSAFSILYPDTAMLIPAAV